MQCVTAVDGYWLAELGPVFFSVKDSSLSRAVSIWTMIIYHLAFYSMLFFTFALSGKEASHKEETQRHGGGTLNCISETEGPERTGEDEKI